MSTLDLHRCPFCGGDPKIHRSSVATWVFCTACMCKGPGVEGVGFEEDLLAAERWNKRGGFGNHRISLVNDALPLETYKLVERIRDTADRLERGQLGDPDKAAILFLNSQRKNITIRELRLEGLELNDIVAATVSALQAKYRVKDQVK